MRVLLIILYLLTIGFGWWLRYLNLSHLRQHGAEIPAGFEEELDSGTLLRTTDYTIDQSRLALVESLWDTLLMLLFVFGPILPWYDRWIASHSTSFVGQGVLFFLVLTLVQTITGIPFSLYNTFRIENRYGFNTMTGRLWLTDLLKSAAIGAILITLLTAGALAIVRWSPHFWWLWVWGFFLVVSLFLMYISPYVIEPLFFKFGPVTAEGLEDEIKAMMEKTGLHVSKVLQVDASRRSRHSNAYFTGIGRVKRIVLFDTMLEQMERKEILAILAHEVGHWKKGHIWKRLVTTEAMALVACLGAYWLLKWPGLPTLAGLGDPSFCARLVILALIGSIVTFPLTPITSHRSRRHEEEADRFAVELSGMPAALATALIKLSRENLANLHPHPLYAKFYYSHPPIVGRVAALREMQSAAPNNTP